MLISSLMHMLSKPLGAELPVVPLQLFHKHTQLAGFHQAEALIMKYS